MPPFRDFEKKELCALLKRHGFAVVKGGGKGSHTKKRKIVNGRKITLIVPAKITPGVLRTIIKKSGIPRSEFEVPTH